MEFSGEFIRMFVPEYDKVDQAKDKRLHSLGKIIAETMSIHAVATELLATQPWDFAAVYYSGIDHFEHGFMGYHPPRLPWVSEEDFAIYRHVVANAYCYHDAMLGVLLGFADADTTVILMSDHGFHSDHLRPGYVPAEPAGPAVEHRHFGILCMKGPTLKAGEPIYGASLLDICPTVLTLFGLPPAKDMDGKVLMTAFKEPPRLEPIDSWDSVPGDAGTHPPSTQLDPVASAQAFKQLVDLGYVAPPGANVEENINECVRELKYNLARAYQDGNSTARRRRSPTSCGRDGPRNTASAYCWWIASGRSARWPGGAPPSRSWAVESNATRSRRGTNWRAARSGKPGKRQGGGAGRRREDQRAQFEERQWRELAMGRPLLMEWLLAGQAVLERKPAEARGYFKTLAEADVFDAGLSQGVAGALAEFGDIKAAETLLLEALESDPDAALVHAQLAGLYFKSGRLDEAIGAATDSLSLVYFQPGVHALLGRALMETGKFPGSRAGTAGGRGAIAPQPGRRTKCWACFTASTCTGRRTRSRTKAARFSLRNELAERQRAGALDPPPAGARLQSAPREQTARLPAESDAIPAPFDPPVDASGSSRWSRGCPAAARR